jgi:hypothetical protein
MYPPSMVRVSSSDEVRVDQIVRRNRTQNMPGTSGYVTLTSGEKVEVTAEYVGSVWEAIDTYLARWETVRAIVVAMPEGSAPQHEVLARARVQIP